MTAGWLLTLGLVLGLSAAWVPSLGPVWNVRPPQQLELIATRQGAWITSNTLFAAGVAAAAFSVSVLVGQLVQTDPGMTSAWVTLAAFLTGIAIWLVHLGFRLTVMVTVSRDMGTGQSMPEWFLPLWSWGNSLLAGYILLASLGLIILGRSLLATQLLPAWTAWTTIAFGTLFIVTLVIFRNTLPVFLHLATGLIGVVALIESFTTG